MVDTASLSFNLPANLTCFLYRRLKECFECDFSFAEKVKNGTKLSIDTKYGTELKLYSKKHDLLEQICKTNSFSSFGENGEYEIYISPHENETTYTCQLNTLQHPDVPYYSLLWAFIFYLSLIGVWVLIKAIKRYNCFQFSEAERLLITDLGSPDEPMGVFHIDSNQDIQLSSTAHKKRLRSLDTFRGISVVLLLFVEYGGGKYSFFEHSRWNGLTLADVVFPWFMWIMGASAALSIHSALRRSTRKRTVFFKIVKRSVILFILGLILNTKDDWCFDSMRILGVLQRFAITYFIVATVELLVTRVSDNIQATTTNWEDLRKYWIQWLFMIALIVAHTLITFLLDVPDCPKGYLGPGGLEKHGNYSNCTGGAAGYIDRIILGENHMYKKPTCKNVYDTTLPYDPEGILGILTATFLVFLGLQAGKIVIFYEDHRARCYRWSAWSVILGITGGILCLFSKNEGWIPLNKNLWSLSFVLVLAGLACAWLTICYILIDIKSIWSGTPFYFAGMNPIILYLGLEFTKNVFPFGWYGCASHGCYLGLALWGTSLWVILAWYMYYKKFFISI